MIVRKIRLMWPLIFPVLLSAIGWVAMLNGDRRVPMIAFTLVLTAGVIRMIPHYLRLRPEEIGAEEQTYQEMWIALIAATVVLVGMEVVYPTSEISSLTVAYAILLPVTAFVAIRGMLRAQRAKREAAKRLSGETEQQPANAG